MCKINLVNMRRIVASMLASAAGPSRWLSSLRCYIISENLFYQHMSISLFQKRKCLGVLNLCTCPFYPEDAEVLIGTRTTT